MLRRRQVPDEYPQAEHLEDSFLLILEDSQRQAASWVEGLRRDTIASLQRDVHYARISVGFKDARRPYAHVQWQSSGRHSLERRWVLSQFYRHLRQQFKVKRLLVFVYGGAEDLVLAEDAFFSQMQPNDEGNDWESCEILQSKVPGLSDSDPHAAARWEGLLGYRRWINENPDELTSLEIGRRLEEFARQHQCSFQELGLEELKKEGMNLLLAVGQGAERSPSRCYIVGHRLSEGTAPLMLLGKGITFDTGGINLKAFESFVNAMKNDMGGAALMSQLFMSLVKSGFDGPLLLVIPCCENLIDGKSMKPGVVVRSHKGLKVFIEHTDAEGRLILADALSYASKRFKPALTLSAATLTTASLRQFSGYFTAVHFASPSFEAGLHEAGSKWGERFSCSEEFLPFKTANATKAADITNMGRLPSHASIGAGSNVAAHFLKEFASGPFVHFDIFASCWNWSGDYPGSAFGATGAPFNSLFELLRQNSKAFLS